jgi:hypothetical protein
MLIHNLGLMHIEKNVVNNIIGTLNRDNKMNDNLNARLDLQKMGLRLELHPVHTATNKTYLPATYFTMTMLTFSKNADNENCFTSAPSKRRPRFFVLSLPAHFGRRKMPYFL